MKMQKIGKVLLLTFLVLVYKTTFAQKIDRTDFYAAMKSGDKDVIDTELGKLTKESEQGYAGALIIRKAGLPKAKERLKSFKEGRNKLEAAITADPDNAELRFLRLSIQEKSPKIVGYKKNIPEDKTYVVKHFDQLAPIVQKAVREYAKESKALKLQEIE